MTLKLYTDVHVPSAITYGLRLRQVDVLTAQEDGASNRADADLLDRATGTNRVLFTQDQDFLVEAARRQAAGIPFSGIVYAEQLRVTIGRAVRDLELPGITPRPPPRKRPS